ncbi:hypothetical protein LZ30DRAFT_294001 [Colletotrichum cereale]|nr:hypothetical protein LZ30DRAFT_294001 [Colletotrichum cereale]
MSEFVSEAKCSFANAQLLFKLFLVLLAPISPVDTQNDGGTNWAFGVKADPVNPLQRAMSRPSGLGETFTPSNAVMCLEVLATWRQSEYVKFNNY